MQWKPPQHTYLNLTCICMGINMCAREFFGEPPVWWKAKNAHEWYVVGVPLVLANNNYTIAFHLPCTCTRWYPTMFSLILPSSWSYASLLHLASQFCHISVSWAEDKTHAVAVIFWISEAFCLCWFQFHPQTILILKLFVLKARGNANVDHQRKLHT